MQVEHEFTVPQPPTTVAPLVTDPDRAVACVPGLSIESAGPGEYGGRMRLRVGSTTVTYKGTARVTSHNGDIVTIELDGQEARGSGTAKGVVKVLLAGDDGATTVTLEADLSVTGRLGELDPTVLEDAVRRLMARFAECVFAGASEAADEPSAETTRDVVRAAAPVTETPPAPPVLERDDLLGHEARRPLWPLRPLVPVLAAVAALGVVIELVRRRRGVR